MRKMVLLT